MRIGVCPLEHGGFHAVLGNIAYIKAIPRLKYIVNSVPAQPEVNNGTALEHRVFIIFDNGFRLIGGRVVSVDFISIRKIQDWVVVIFLRLGFIDNDPYHKLIVKI
jgi:hypothetical protein